MDRSEGETIGNAITQRMADARRLVLNLTQPGSEGWTSADAPLAEELSTIFEELEVTLEELRQSNGELALAQESIEKAGRRYREMFDFAPIAYVETDTFGGIKEANRAAAELLGASGGQLVGKPLSLFVAHTDRRLFRQRLSVASEGTDVRGLEVRIEPRHRPAFFAGLEVSPVTDDKDQITGLRWMIRDLTERRLDESLLRESEARLQLVIGQIPAIVWTTNSDLRITSLEGAGLRSVDASGDEAIGTHLAEFFGAADAPMDAHRSALDGSSARYEFMRSGTHLTCYVEPLRAVGGVIQGCIGVAYDITEQRQAELALAEREARLRLLVEQVPAILWTTDNDLRITGSQGSGLAAMGMQPDELVGMKLADVLGNDHPEHRPMSAHLRALEGERASYEMEWRGRPYSVCVEPLTDADGSIAGCVAVALDMTEERRVHEALEGALERERAASEQLQKMNEMKDLLMRTLSHDMRNPLTAVLGHSLTLERLPSLETDQARDMIRRIARNARKMEGMLRDLLDLDRLDKRILEPQRAETDVGELARRVMTALEVEDHPISVEAGAVLASVDAAKVERILENLIGDAAKHTPTGTPIWVRVAPHDDGGVLIIVEDAGLGLPDADKLHAFEPFFRGEGAAPNGLGIGLTIVARFAELHGGRAWVEDRPGGGASFHVLLCGTSEQGASGRE